jgi:hypothetical protein
VKKLLLLLLLIPVILMAQPSVTKDKGTYTIDFSKKKKTPKDTTSIQSTEDEEVDENGNAVKVKGKKYKPAIVHRPTNRKPYNYDFRTEGIFKGLFIAGLNACQIDGDNEWGYKYFGAEVGVGALARFHNVLSTSLELDYTMKGARARLPSTPDQLEMYNVQWDYISAPVALNAHIKDIVMFSIGLAPGVMTRYKEFNYDGINVTSNPPYGQPRKFDLDIFTGIHFIIKKHYALGLKYSYSLIPIRDALIDTRVNGQYNNVLTFRFVYILGQIKKKSM